jgi:hypothetical protein
MTDLSNQFSTYADRLEAGPFPGTTDPWAEVGCYFQQIHSDMLSEMLHRLRRPLWAKGYFIGKEVSLQIAERQEPDIHVSRQDIPTQSLPQRSYAALAAELTTDVGTAFQSDEAIAGLEAVYIRRIQPAGQLTTVVEVISPRNKTTPIEIDEYGERRRRLVYGRGVNVVEIDLSRSVKHMLRDPIVRAFAYHIAIHLPDEKGRLIGMDFGLPLKRFTIPLRSDGLPIDLQGLYNFGYQNAGIASQILYEHRYTERDLPFPSLLTEGQRQDALAAVARWRAELTRLQAQTPDATE